MSIVDHIKDHAKLKTGEFRGAMIAQNASGSGSAASTTIRTDSGTYAYAPLGKYTKIKMDLVIKDTESCANVDNTTVNVTAITVGATTLVTLASNPWGLVVGDLMTLEGLTGVDAAFLNGQTFAITVISTLDFTLNVNTTGKTITRDGSTTAGDGEYSTIMVPSWVKYLKVTGHLTYPDQNVAAGHARVHIWRAAKSANLTTDGSTNQAYGAAPGLNWLGLGHRPTPEAHYHNSIYYPQLATALYVSLVVTTPWIPVLATNEIWSLFGYQDTGASVVSGDAAENWFALEFK